MMKTADWDVGYAFWFSLNTFLKVFSWKYETFLEFEVKNTYFYSYTIFNWPRWKTDLFESYYQ